MASQTRWLAEMGRAPELGIKRIRAKVDTGARTSVLHAFFVERKGKKVRFGVHPLRSSKREVWCERRWWTSAGITDSGGHREPAAVIRTMVGWAATAGRSR